MSVVKTTQPFRVLSDMLLLLGDKKKEEEKLDSSVVKVKPIRRGHLDVCTCAVSLSLNDRNRLVEWCKLEDTGHDRLCHCILRCAVGRVLQGAASHT